MIYILYVDGSTLTELKRKIEEDMYIHIESGYIQRAFIGKGAIVIFQYSISGEELKPHGIYIILKKNINLENVSIPGFRISYSNLEKCKIRARIEEIEVGINYEYELGRGTLKCLELVFRSKSELEKLLQKYGN